MQLRHLTVRPHFDMRLLETVCHEDNISTGLNLSRPDAFASRNIGGRLRCQPRLLGRNACSMFGSVPSSFPVPRPARSSPPVQILLMASAEQPVVLSDGTLRPGCIHDPEYAMAFGSCKLAPRPVSKNSWRAWIVETPYHSHIDPPQNSSSPNSATSQQMHVRSIQA